MKLFSRLFFFLNLIIAGLVFAEINQSHIEGTWINQTNSSQLMLSQQGNFKYSGSDASFQGLYAIEDEYLLMRDELGNMYQYMMTSLTATKLLLEDKSGVVYTFVKTTRNDVNQAVYSGKSDTEKLTDKIDYPWNKEEYQKVLASSGKSHWRERDTQIYVILLEFLIGKAITSSEANLVRQGNLKDFKSSPAVVVSDVRQVELALEKIYSSTDDNAMSQIKNNLFSSILSSIQNEPNMRKTPFIRVLNQYVNILNNSTVSQIN